jgi:hypothetical protein
VLDAATSKPDAFLWTDTYVSSIQLKIYLWIKQAYFNLKNLSSKKNSLQTQNQTAQGNHVLDAPDSNPEVFIREIRVFPQLSCICVFGTNRAYLHFEKPKL